MELKQKKIQNWNHPQINKPKIKMKDKMINQYLNKIKNGTSIITHGNSKDKNRGMNRGTRVLDDQKRSGEEDQQKFI